MINYENIKESLESLYPWVSISSIVDYLETCVCDNYEINGSSAIKFYELRDLVLTYLDEIKISKRDFDNIMLESRRNKKIMSLVSHSYI